MPEPKSENYNDLIFKLGDLARERLAGRPNAPRSMDRVLKAEETLIAREEELKGIEAAMDEEEAAYNEFRTVNAEFKALVTDWQVRDGQPNTHEDSGYDAAVFARLDDVHQRVTPVLAAAADQLPRLSRYTAKLQTALDKVHAGDTVWLSRPLIDSYHTVWFELHEEFILAAGRTRENDDG